MKYRLKNLIYQEGVTPADARSHANEKYAWITAELFNAADPFGNPSRLPRFYIMEPGLVEMYKPYMEPIPGQPGQMKVNEVSILKAISEGACMDIMNIGNVFMVEWPLGEKYVRLDRTTRQPVLNKDGIMVPTETLVLYLKKSFDPDTNEWQWVESPSSVAQRVLSRSYKPLAQIEGATAAPATTAAAPATTAPEGETPEQKAERLKAELAKLGM